MSKQCSEPGCTNKVRRDRAATCCRKHKKEQKSRDNEIKFQERFLLLNRFESPHITICHQYGCNSDNVHRRFQGWFCLKHAAELTEIRNKILTCKNSPTNQHSAKWEIELRQEELNFRKDHEAGHMRRLYILGG
jgi:hypothetical protein